MPAKISFGSDNHSGVHPSVLLAIQQANQGHQPAYGHDTTTAQASQLIKQHFGSMAESYFVFTGTAANTLAVRAICRPFEAVITADIAHLNVDECGAPEFNGGHKLLTLPHRDGKIAVDQLATLVIDQQNPHRVLPRLLSLTQATELGTVYDPKELNDICLAAHKLGLIVHMDGARLANAAVHLGCELRTLTADVGIDVVSFGGTKNGLLCGEVLIFLQPHLASEFAFIRKQSMQLASKMRYLSCQFMPYLGDDLWRANASNANQAAQYLRQRLAKIAGVQLPYPTQANSVFFRGPSKLGTFMQKYAHAYIWDDGLIRMVCSYDTTTDHVDQLLTNFGQFDLD